MRWIVASENRCLCDRDAPLYNSSALHGEGVGAAGGHLEWLVAVVVTSPNTQARRGGVLLMYRPPYDHHGLCLQVAKLKRNYFSSSADPGISTSRASADSPPHVFRSYSTAQPPSQFTVREVA